MRQKRIRDCMSILARDIDNPRLSYYKFNRTVLLVVVIVDIYCFSLYLNDGQPL